jgi:protein-disulfide isomerase
MHSPRSIAVLASVSAFCLLLLPGPHAARADDAAGFTPAQRATIVEIMRNALKSDPSILRDAIAALQDEEASVKDAAARTAIGKAGSELTQAPGDPVAGNPNGDVTVVEFYDVRCPYCRRMLPVVADLLRSDSKVRFVYKDIPILGPASVVGAKAVLAAQRQGGYQRLHDLIMSGPPTVTENTVRADAIRAGLDWGRLQRDMDDPAIVHRLNDNLSLARALGIDGTPAYVIGGRLLPGALDLAQLQDAVAAARVR